jgi:hypothetical protein
MVNRMTDDIVQLIQERIQLHPHATASEIAGSLELDGVRVSAVQVHQVMSRTEHAREQIDGICFETR